MTIGDAVVEIVNSLQDYCEFSGLWLTAEVRYLRRDKTMDGSATKLLRVARRKGTLNYEVVDRGKSLYRKLPVYSQPAIIRYQEEKDGQLAIIL